MQLSTIGYEGRSPAELARRLKEAGVVRLIDVRLTPRSRVRGFSLMGLFERLRKSGITYEHQPGLGNPIEIRELFLQGKLREGRKRYRALMLNGHAGDLDRLLLLAKIESTAILCREGDVNECHRGVLAELAEERGFRIVHL